MAAIVDPFQTTAISDPFVKEDLITDPFTAYAKATVESGVKTAATLPAVIAGAKVGAKAGAGVGAWLGHPAAKPIGAGVGAILGGLGGAVASGGVYDKIKDTISEYVPDELASAVGMNKQQREAERVQNPEASFAGDLSGMGVAFRPGALEDIALQGGKVITPMMQRAGLATLGGGMETIAQATGDKPMDPMHIAEATVAGAVMAKPTRLTEAMGGLFTKFKPKQDIGGEGFTTRREPWVPPSEVNGVPVIVGEVGRTKPDGTKVAATHTRNEDGTSKAIIIDRDQLTKDFENQTWTI